LFDSQNAFRGIHENQIRTFQVMVRLKDAFACISRFVDESVGIHLCFRAYANEMYTSGRCNGMAVPAAPLLRQLNTRALARLKAAHVHRKRLRRAAGCN
jgi:hypothetical protein